MNQNDSSLKREIQIYPTELTQLKNEDRISSTESIKKTVFFVPKISIKIQIEDFNLRRKNKLWNGQIVFLGFKGALKIEYWVALEETLRSVNELSKLTFIDTQLDIERLVLLSSLIQLIQPKELSLKFKQNEMDDRGLEAFLNDGLMGYLERRMKQFIVVSNPGIFKGYFLKKFKIRLAKISLANKFNFNFFKNKQYKSFGFIKISKNLPRADEQQLEQKLIKDLQESYYFNLSFKHCFDNDNYQTFQYLIEQTYREDKLEQIESLDVGHCLLGTENVLQKMFQRISTSKGLLSLGLAQSWVAQSRLQIFQEHLIQSLSGDKYQQLRLNQLDLRDYDGFIGSAEKNKILTYNLISIQIRTLYLELNQQSSDQGRLIGITQAFMNRIEDLKNSIKKDDQLIPKLNIKIIYSYQLERLSSDTVVQFLTTVVLNEFSVCEEFIIEHVYYKEVIKCYLDALDIFELNIQLMKKLNPVYTDFLPKLCKIGMHNQFIKYSTHIKYPTDIKLIESFFRRLFFTRSTDLLQIITINLNEDSLINQKIKPNLNGQGLVNFFKSLQENDQKDDKILFSLQHLRMKKSGLNFLRQTDNFQLLFKNVVFSNHFKLISLTLIREFIEDDDWVEFLQLGQMFLQQIPSGQFWTLKQLTLYNLMGSLDLLKLIELLVFNDKLKLLELTVIRQNVLYVDESMKSLRQKAYQFIQPMSLQKLHLGKFRNDLCGNDDFLNEFNLNEFNANDTDLEYKEDQFCYYNDNGQSNKGKRIKSITKNINQNTLEENNFKQLQTFQILIEVLVLHPMNNIIELLLDSSKIQQIFTIYWDQIKKQSQEGHKSFENLKSLILVDFNDYTEEQWELIGDIFVYCKDSAITSIEFRHTKITSAMSHGLKKSLIKKQNNQSNKMELDDLKALKFNECQFDDELFSLLFSKEQNGDQILHIKNCAGIDNAIEFFKQTYESNKGQLLNLNISLCELIVDDTEFSSDELFKWFFGTIVLNTKTQKLQYLQMQRNNLNDSKFKILNVILQELKEYNQVQRQKNYFRLRKFNFDGNSEISYSEWRSFFDVLFTIYDVHEHKENYQFDQQKVQLSCLQEDKSNVRDEMCEKNAQLILKKRLSIPEKLIANPNLYNMTPPKQLYRLELQLYYDDKSQQQCFYTSILRSLVYFTGSQLRELSLHFVQLDWFLNSTEQCFQSAAESFSIQLKGLELLSIEGGNEIQMKRLAELYIKNQQINLEVLILRYAEGNFYQNLTECIEESLILGKVFIIIYYQVCNLRTLILQSIASNLNFIQTLNFFKTVVFNKYVPLNILHLYNGQTPELNFDFHSDYTIYSQICDHLVQQNHKCHLQSVNLSYQSSNNTLNRLLPLFMSGLLVKLNEFNINITKKDKEDYKQDDEHVLFDDSKRDALQLLFINLCDEQALVNFTITDLSLSFERKLTLEEFKFLYYVRPKLKYIYLRRLSRSFDNPEQISEFLQSENLSIDKKSKKPCCLQIQFDDEQNSDAILFTEYFLLAQTFQWSDISIEDQQIVEFTDKLSSINYIPQCEDLVNKLRILTLYFYRGFEDIIIGWKAIGDHFIYNERSNLDELKIRKDSMKIEELQNLTSNAQVFRNKIGDNKKQEKTILKLKKFIIITTEAMEDDGANIICKDISFFEYITIGSVNLEATNWNSAMSISQCNHAQAWLQFQKTHKRENLSFSLKSADWSRNEKIRSQEAWSMMCDTFLFSDNAPLLENLNLSQMAIKDEQVSYIFKKADDFFRLKGKDYRSPLKTLNFSGNNSISEQGWKSISEMFFFSSCVDLEELNLIGIDLNMQKCKVIYSSATKKADQKKQKKLNLHTLYCKSSTFKFQFKNIMKPGPTDQYYLYDQYLLQDFEDDIPYSLGQFTSLVNRALYHTKYFKQSDRWEKILTISEFHMDITSGLLRPLSKYFEINNHQLGHFPVDIATCEELCTMFKYRDSVGDPYPYQLFFTSDACQFYSHASCKIRVINFIKTKINNAEKVNQFQVLELWEQVKSTKTSLDMVFMDYQFDEDLVDYMKQKGYTERDVVNLVRLFPPSSLILRVSLTLQALKGIYSIMYDDHQFNYAQILYDTDTSLNVGIGYSLRETVYKTNPTHFTARCIKSIMYHFFDFFVTPVSKYSLTKEIRELNFYLSNQENYLVMLTLFTIIYFVICLFSPYAWQHYYPPGDSDSESICSEGITDLALYSYLVFAFFSFIAEGFLYRKISEIIPEHIQGLVQKDEVYQQKACQVRQSPIEEEQISLRSSPQIQKQEQNLLMSNNHQDSLVKKDIEITNQESSFIKKLTILAQSKNGRILGYMIDLTLSQVAKMSLFTDVSFIMLTFYCKYQVISLLALISTGFNVSLQLYELIMFIVTHCFIQHKNKAKLLSTKYINDFYEISVLSRNIALSTILDIIAPYNVTVIPNNSLTRSLFPFYAGKSMSNSVRSYIVKFLFGDLPHIILQLYFVINVAYHPPKDSSDTGVAQPVVINPLLYVTIFNTIRGVLFSFMRLMQIRPSSISQEDFDDLIEQKQEEFMDSQINFIKQEQEIFEELTFNIHEYP